MVKSRYDVPFNRRGIEGAKVAVLGKEKRRQMSAVITVKEISNQTLFVVCHCFRSLLFPSITTIKKNFLNIGAVFIIRINDDCIPNPRRVLLYLIFHKQKTRVTLSKILWKKDIFFTIKHEYRKHPHPNLNSATRFIFIPLICVFLNIYWVIGNLPRYIIFLTRTGQSCGN